MKTILLLISCLFLIPGAVAGEKKPVDPNPSFQKLIAGATRIVVRDGGDICCSTPAETLKQPVYFEVKDPEEIKKVAENIKFEVGTEPNGCLCCGHPGVDWYVGDRRVAISAVKHGMGLMRASVISTFTPASKEWMEKWLVSHGITKEQIR
jgi:hypothetical protein